MCLNMSCTQVNNCEGMVTTRSGIRVSLLCKFHPQLKLHRRLCTSTDIVPLKPDLDLELWKGLDFPFDVRNPTICCERNDAILLDQLNRRLNPNRDFGDRGRPRVNLMQTSNRCCCTDSPNSNLNYSKPDCEDSVSQMYKLDNKDDKNNIRYSHRVVTLPMGESPSEPVYMTANNGDIFPATAFYDTGSQCTLQNLRGFLPLLHFGPSLHSDITGLAIASGEMEIQRTVYNTKVQRGNYGNDGQVPQPCDDISITSLGGNEFSLPVCDTRKQRLPPDMSKTLEKAGMLTKGWNQQLEQQIRDKHMTRDHIRGPKAYPSILLGMDNYHLFPTPLTDDEYPKGFKTKWPNTVLSRSNISNRIIIEGRLDKVKTDKIPKPSSFSSKFRLRAVECFTRIMKRD